MKSYRLFAFLAAALITFDFLIVMITNDVSIASVTGATRLTLGPTCNRPVTDWPALMRARTLSERNRRDTQITTCRIVQLHWDPVLN
jgi:hypothetical protein